LKDNDKTIIDTSKESKIVLNLKEPIKNKILFIDFSFISAMNCSKGDTRIRINDVENTLTCKQWQYFNNNYHFKYVISSNEQIDKLNIILSKGHMEIKNIKTYILDYDEIKNIVNSLDKFIVDMDHTKGDKIVGDINVKKDGYFVTTIPYDKGFTIYINDEKTNYERVNDAFIGFKIKKGEYKIEMIYKSPGYNLGLICSVVGFIIFSVIIVLDFRKKEVI
jgi:uncharacterized membrane protein YfhO